MGKTATCGDIFGCHTMCLEEREKAAMLPASSAKREEKGHF